MWQAIKQANRLDVEVDMDRLIAVLVVLMMVLVAGFGAGSTGLSQQTVVSIVSHHQVERSPAVVHVNK